MNSKKTMLCAVLITVLLFAFQTGASKLGGFIAGCFDYSGIDPDNCFMGISVHHIVQMLAAFLGILVIHSLYKIDFCLKPVWDRRGIRYFLIFAGCVTIYALASYLIGYSLKRISPYPYELNPQNVTGTLAFQLFLSGPSEELLFRTLPICVLMSVLPARKGYWPEIVVAALLFSAAHIGWTVHPFAISYSVPQLIMALVYGLAYGFVFVKTRSVIYPMLMHSCSNFIMVGLGYLLQTCIGG